MDQTPVNPYEILAAILLFVSIFCGLTYGSYRLFKFINRIHGKFKKIIIEPSNDADDDFGIGI